MEKFIKRAKDSITQLPDKKRYLELVTAILTVPVLATAIILNFNNLKPKEAAPTPTPTVQERVVYISPSRAELKDEPKDTEACIKEIAPISITSPVEGEVVTDNPVSINIAYNQGKYCAAVWSYRMNNGRWSDYNDRSIALEILTPGVIRFDLRVKSIVTGEERTLTRTFTFDGPTNSDSPTASESAQ